MLGDATLHGSSLQPYKRVHTRGYSRGYTKEYTKESKYTRMIYFYFLQKTVFLGDRGITHGVMVACRA